MKPFMLEVLTPQKTLFWGKALSLKLAAIDGELMVLNRHCPYVNILSPGEVLLYNEDKQEITFRHSGGILEVSCDKTSVLVYPEKE